MNLKKINIELSIVDVQQIIRIALDEEPHEALTFIKENLFKRVQTSLQPHWVPVFEVSYGPAQTERFWENDAPENPWFQN